jgi:hypothetical protein
MCMKYSKTCECGKRHADMNFGGDILPHEVVDRLYCPSCSADVEFDPATMVEDNGWILQLDMEVARASAPRLPGHVKLSLTPDVLFDAGYVTWLGMYPGDLEDSAKEREEIVCMAKTEPREYLKKMTEWMTGRAQRLSMEGWRKARDVEVAG